MKSLVQTARSVFEKLTGFSVYRTPLPHGSRLFSDLKRVPGWAPPTIIFDIGAHQGETIGRFGEEYPGTTIHAFEPSSQNVEKLRGKFAGTLGVSIHAIALGSRNGKATLHLTDKNSTTNSLVHSVNSSRQEEVRVATIDSFCEGERIAHIHYCKIDTEGADLEVLRGATGMLAAQKIDFVQVETSVRRDTSYFAPFVEIDAFLNERRYEVFGFYEQQQCWSGRSSLLFFNAVYVRSTMVEHLPVGWG